MKNLLRIFKPTIFALMLLFVVSCDNDDDDNKPTIPVQEDGNIVETAQGNNGLSSLVAALSKADESTNNDLINALSNEAGTFTVLAPSNDAFTALLGRLDGFDSLEDFNTEQLQDLLATILTYHVASGAAVASTDLTEGMTITTLQGENLTVSLEGGAAFIDAEGEASNVVTADVLANNGIVHVIDRVLIPQAAIDALGATLLNNIVDLAIATPFLTNLVAALGAANGDLPTVLSSDGPFTVFAPTDDAFAAFLEANNFATLGDVPVDVLTQVLLNHVVEGSNFSTDLSTGYVSTLSTAGAADANLNMFVNIDDGVVLNGGATNSGASVNLDFANIKATNGVVHVVDAVIRLPNIVNHAVANPALTSLVGLLTADGNTNFTDLLSDNTTDYTVFAPINSAFGAFTNPNENDINNILSNHVVPNAVAFSSILVNSYVKTAAENTDGDKLSLYINTDDGITFNGSSSVVAGNFDIVATNGVIHAVNEVIDLPTVVTFAASDPNLSTLLRALTELTPATNFASILSTSWGTDSAPFTVFAPINQAFEAIPILPEEEALTQILLHHVIGLENTVASDLSDGAVSSATLEGDALIFSVAESGAVSITDGAGNTDINVIAINIQAANGVVHAIDKVMIPDTTN